MEARDADQHPTVHRIDHPTHNKEFSIQLTNNSEAKEF